MLRHHRDAIGRWAEAAADDEVPALVVAGSLAKGYGLADSDVGGFVVGTDQALPLAGRAVTLISAPPSSATTRAVTSSASTSTGPSSKPSWSGKRAGPVGAPGGDRGLVDADHRGVWSQVKRGMWGVHHPVCRQHLDEYVWRFNHRREGRAMFFSLALRSSVPVR